MSEETAGLVIIDGPFDDGIVRFAMKRNGSWYAQSLYKDDHRFPFDVGCLGQFTLSEDIFTYSWEKLSPDGDIGDLEDISWRAHPATPWVGT